MANDKASTLSCIGLYVVEGSIVSVAAMHPIEPVMRSAATSLHRLPVGPPSTLGSPPVIISLWRVSQLQKISLLHFGQ